MSFLGGAQERLSFVLQLDDRGAVRAFGQLRASAQRDLGEVDNRLDRVAGKMQVGGAAAVGFSLVAGRALLGFARSSEEAEAQQRKLDLALSNAPRLAGANRAAFVGLADSLQDLTGADGDAIVGLEGLLGTLGRSQEEITELTPLVVDLAARFGLGLEQAGTLANRAWEGNTTRLEKLIGRMREGETVTEALRRTVGGFAEQEAQSLSGQLRILEANLGDIQEGLGVGVVSSVNSALGPVSRFVDTIAEGNPELLAAGGRILTIGTAATGVIGGLSVLAGTAARVSKNFADGADGLNRWGQAAKGAAAVGVILAGAELLSSLSGSAESAQLAADAVDGYREALEKVGDAQETAIDRTSGGALANSRFGSELRSVGADLTVFADAIEDGSASAERFRRVNFDLALTTDQLAQAMRDAGIENEDLIAEFVRLKDEGLDPSQLRAFARDLGTLGGALTDVRTDTDNQAFAAGQLGSETEELTEETDNHTAAVQANSAALQANQRRLEERLDAVRSTLGLDLDLAEAQLASTAALEDYRFAMGDATSTERDRQQAGINLLQTYLDEGEAARDNAETQATAAGRASTATREGAVAQILSLTQLANTLSPGSPLRVQLEAFIAQLQLIRTVASDINISGNSAGIRIGAKAAGGSFGAGDVDVVGEEGPEIVKWGRSGTVIPTDKISLAPAAATSTVINVAVDRAHVDERRLGEKIGRDIAWAMR